VENPRDPSRDLALLALTSGAVATSSMMRRRWRHDGREHHHLIDPRTGASAETDVLAATVVAGSAAVAEVFAKAAVIAGAEAGRCLLASRGLAGLLALADGSVCTTSEMEAYLWTG
jgi:thiamine biosynthesis lipoprotein